MLADGVCREVVQMIDKRVIIGYLDKRKLNRELRGYTYIIEVLYITGRVSDTGVAYDMAIEQAIREVAESYGVTEMAVNASIRNIFKDANIKQTVKNTLRGMFYEISSVEQGK